MDKQSGDSRGGHAFDDTIVVAAEACTIGGCTDDNESLLHAALNVNNVVHQRRRVNPESLALRLGPELVRDLDALIAPGNTDMPSFAVRKELQERYNIDRRHIYDYFHSKGLRVVKEDKHGNPIVAKDLPTSLPNLRPLRQVPSKTSRPHASYPVIAAEKRLSKPRGVTKAKPGRPKKNPPALNPKVDPIVCETHDSNESTETDPVSEHSPSGTRAPTPTYVVVNPLLPHILPFSMPEECTFSPVVNPLDESFSVKRAIGDIAYAYRHKLVFERMQELAEQPAKAALADDRLPSWTEASPCSASGKGLLLPHAKPLTRDERHAIYESLSSSLGPAHGIQECQGTYRKHMEARTKLYFEGLLSAPYHDIQQPAKTTFMDRKPSEFRHWLSETRFLKRDGIHINGSPRLHSSHRNVNVANGQDTDGETARPFRQISIAYGVQTLDDLFPIPEVSKMDDHIMDSPVARTRAEATGMTSYTRRVFDQSGTGDQLLYPVTSGLSLPISTSVTEIRPTGHAQIHGLSGFPGPQQLPTSVAEIDDHHLQWPEHVSHTAHTGQHPALSNSQCRGRNMSNNGRTRLPSGSPRQIRDLERIWTRPAVSRDARRRTPSGAGDI